MSIDRRTILSGAGLALLAGAARAQTASQTASSPAPALAAPAAPAPTVEERLAARAAENRHALAFDGRRFSGPGWDLLVDEGKRAKFFMLGEEHGLAENAHLSAQLVETLAPVGYNKLVVEISPPMAQEIGAALDRGGLAGLQRYYAQHQTGVAFYTMAEEAHFLARARKVLPRGEDALWGLDYEVAADRRLIARLKVKPKPAAARTPMTALITASTAAWADYERSRNPGMIFSFSGDPKLVRDLRAAWPDPDPESDWILDTLEGTLEANNHWVQQREWDSNQRRAELMRANWNRYWRALGSRARDTRAFFKFGASHLVRGRNMSEVMDMGSLIHETAALEDKTSFNIFVVGGKGAQTAQFNPVEWRYNPGPASDAEDQAIGFLTEQALPQGFTVIDLRPLRTILTAGRAARSNPKMVRVVHGFDALVVMPGAHASLNL